MNIQNILNRHKKWTLIILPFFLLACGPEVGSEAWCKKMEKKKPQDMSIKDSQAYVEHCTELGDLFGYNQAQLPTPILQQPD